MSIVLDTPEQIAMWVLLSRRAQIKMQLKGIKTPGLVKWCRENIEGAEKARTARDCILPVEYAIVTKGGPQDFSLVNVHVMERVRSDVFQDLGVYPDMATVEASGYLVNLYKHERLEIVYTLEDVRGPNGNLFTSA